MKHCFSLVTGDFTLCPNIVLYKGCGRQYTISIASELVATPTSYAHIVEAIVLIYGSREVHFFLDLFRSCTYIPTVVDSRRLSPIRDRKIRAMKKSSLMPCGLSVQVKSWPLNFHWTTILNSRKTVPLDGKQCDIVLVIILCDRASMFTVCHPNLLTLIELLYTLVDPAQL